MRLELDCNNSYKGCFRLLLMGFDKSYSLWERECVAGPGGFADEYDNIYDDIVSMSHPIGKDSKKRMMHEHCFWTEVVASNDLVEGHSVEEDEHRSIVRIEISPRGEAPERLVALLKDRGFKKRC